MLRSLLKQSSALRSITKQSASLATCTRQIRGAQPSLIEANDESFQQNTSKYTLRLLLNRILSDYLDKVYTVRPVAFWMDKILEKENKRPLDVSPTQYQHVSVNKAMSDSYMEEYLPFKSSPTLLDEYITTGGKVRIGKILEDLDALAGAISYKHMDTFVDSPPLTVVTASVDRMELLMPNTVEDFKLSGHVAYVGKSSMEGKISKIR